MNNFLLKPFWKNIGIKSRFQGVFLAMSFVVLITPNARALDGMKFVGAVIYNSFFNQFVFNVKPNYNTPRLLRIIARGCTDPCAIDVPIISNIFSVAILPINILGETSISTDKLNEEELAKLLSTEGLTMDESRQVIRELNGLPRLVKVDKSTSDGLIDISDICKNSTFNTQSLLQINCASEM